jgi:hypothetical protein
VYLILLVVMLIRGSIITLVLNLTTLLLNDAPLVRLLVVLARIKGNSIL